MAQVLKCADADFVDFLRLCFIWDPESRITPEEALEHQWIVKGFPQLALTSIQRSNGSLSLDKSDSARNTLGLLQPDSQKYFSTRTKDSVEAVTNTNTASKPEEKKKGKSGLNQSLMNPTKTTTNAGLHSTANLISVNLVVPNKETTTTVGEAKDSAKLQDKLLKLKAKLKLMTTKTVGGTVAGTTKNAGKKNFVFNVAPKKSTVTIENNISTTVNSTRNKQSLKQSSIF